MKTFFTLVFLLLFQFAFAQWNTVITPTSNSLADIEDISFINDSVAFATYNGTGCELIKTTNAGLNWTCLNSPFSSMIKLDFLTNNLGYSIDGRIAYKTVNGANSWSQIKAFASRFEFYSDLCFTSTTDGYILATQFTIPYDIVYKTTNQGVSWTSDTISNMVTGRTIYFQSQDTGFVAGSSGNSNGAIISYTHDGGVSWNPVLLSNIASIDDVFFLNHNVGYATGTRIRGNEIVKTIDGGITWNYISPGGSGNNPLKSIYFTSLDTGYAVGISNRAIQTLDGGITWTNMNLTGDFRRIIFNSNGIGIITGNNKLMLRNQGSLSTNISSQQLNLNNIEIYPNPAKELINVDCKESLTVFIYNLQGKLIKQREIGPLLNQVDIRDLIDGLYLIKVSKDSNILKTSKLIVVK